MSSEAHVDADKLPEDLTAIMDDCILLTGVVDEKRLLEKLIIYIVHRDHKVLEHGIKLGKEQNVKKA